MHCTGLYLMPSAPVCPAFSLPARSTRFSWDIITCTPPDNKNKDYVRVQDHWYQVNKEWKEEKAVLVLCVHN